MSCIADALKKAGLADEVFEAHDGAMSLESFRSPVEIKPAGPSPAAGKTERLRLPVAARRSASDLAPTSDKVAIAPRSPVLERCGENERLVAGHHLNSFAGQQYRKIASSLHQLQVERRLQSILVTSAVTGEGKSLTAANLALTLSESYLRRVLLIDADLRRPALHKLLGVSGDGLSDLLRRQNDVTAPLVAISKHLSLLPAGRPNSDPVGALSSERLKHVIEDAIHTFDWVIVDSPPVALFPDAELISMLVDGVLLVVRADSTGRAQAQRAIATLTPERIIGAVLNHTEKMTVAENSEYYGDPGRYFDANGSAVDDGSETSRSGA